MTNIALMGSQTDIAELRQSLEAQGVSSQEFAADGFDGGMVATLVLQITGLLAAPAAAILAAVITSQKQVVVKVNGIEVHANTAEEAQALITQLTTEADTPPAASGDDSGAP